MAKLLFCKTCLSPVKYNNENHAIWYEQGLDGTVLIVNDKIVSHPMIGAHFKFDKINFYGLVFTCPNKHLVFLAPTKEQLEEQKRLQFSFGKKCRTHLFNKHAICNQRKPCEECIAYQDYQEKHGEPLR
jgi:hypothetical protein